MNVFDEEKYDLKLHRLLKSQEVTIYDVNFGIYVTFRCKFVTFEVDDDGICYISFEDSHNYQYLTTCKEALIPSLKSKKFLEKFKELFVQV